MYSGADVKYRLFFSYFKESYFLDRFTTNTQIPNFMQICPQGAAFHADRRTDRQTDRQRDVTKLTVAFCSFANAPEN